MDVWFQNECISAVHDGFGKWGTPLGRAFLDRERVINCWSDGMDVSKGTCIATELFREYTTPVIIIMDNVGHMERCTIQHENARETFVDFRAIQRAHQVWSLRWRSVK